MELKLATSTKIREASEKEDYLKCWDLVKLLRPHLNQDRYLTLMLYMLDEGYKLIYLEEGDKILSICGYRYTTALDTGRSLSIDDLCTHPEERGKGYARQLYRHVLLEAEAEELRNIHLDIRHKDHEVQRMCLNEGFYMVGHHLIKQLAPSYA